MNNEEQHALTRLEKFCIGILAVIAGITLAAVVGNAALNLLLYHRLTAPVTEDTNLAGGFALLALLPIGLLLAVCTTAGCFYLFHKLK
ncbi:hypothetical protein [Candidatus Burkholderia verschuerenii]|uniref:hypothetical protein n=1 Tax=Candidatus Burkholderia verschuerenii TaxID=242163 RepID=UPI00067DDFFB|nr:hypothetical protein [Candidatus Burkholderia verschuerenii]